MYKTITIRIELKQNKTIYTQQKGTQLPSRVRCHPKTINGPKLMKGLVIVKKVIHPRQFGFTECGCTGLQYFVGKAWVDLKWNLYYKDGN